MMRRILSLLLAALILLQNVASPHAHASADGGNRHEVRPHVHLPFLASTHHHSHGHHHDDETATTTELDEGATMGNHARDDDSGDSLPASPSDDDHDADAIYLTTAVIASDHGSKTRSQCVESVMAVSTSYPAPFLRDVPPPRALPPPIVGCFACPLYLQTIALLI